MKMQLRVRTTIWMLLGFIVVMTGYAEVLIFPLGQGGRLAVATNETLVISALNSQGGTEMPGLQAPLGVIANGISNSFWFGSFGPHYFTGPKEIVFPGTRNHLISFSRRNGSQIRTDLISQGQTNTISVPSGKTLRILSFLYFRTSEGIGVIKMRQGTNEFFLYELGQGQEFSGPLEVDICCERSPGSMTTYYSYCFTEDFLVLPELGLLQGPTGNFEVSVEKSTNLQDWYPVVVHNATDEQKAFYRLRMTK